MVVVVEAVVVFVPDVHRCYVFLVVEDYVKEDIVVHSCSRNCSSIHNRCIRYYSLVVKEDFVLSRHYCSCSCICSRCS